MEIEKIVELYRNPNNYGTLDNPTISYEEGNPFCGDKIRIDIKIKDNKIYDIKFSGKGCTISIASASILTDFVKGKNINEVIKISKEKLLELIGIPITPIRLKCALLSLKVLKVALYNVRNFENTNKTKRKNKKNKY